MTLLDEVKTRLSIVDVVSDYVALENLSSRTPKALCPFHDERTPSFSLSLEHNSWRCWGACSVGGDIVSFVMRADGVEFKEALEKLARQAGLDPADFYRGSNSEGRTRTSSMHEVNAVAEEFYNRQLEGAEGAEALAYLESRGIDASTARRRGIGYAPSGVNSLKQYMQSIGADSRAVVNAGLVIKGSDGTWRDMFMDRITISIRDPRGNIVGFGARAMGDAQPKYLNTHETQIFNKSELLYGMNWAGDAVRASGRAVIVEGYMDVLAAQERGFKNVVACMGTSVTPQQLQAVAAILPDDPDRPASIVLCLDMDEAGRQATLRGLSLAISEFGRINRGTSGGTGYQRRSGIDIRVASPVVTDQGTPKDPDEAIRQNSAEWVASIEQADEVMEFVIRSSIDSHDTATDNGIDAVLTEVEPYFEHIPPSKIKEIKALNLLANRLELPLDSLRHSLSIRRQSRSGESNGSSQSRSTGRSRSRNRNRAKSPVTIPTTIEQAGWELTLLACMVQYRFAIDHTGAVEPMHLSDPIRRLVFDRLRATNTLADCRDEIAEIPGADELFNRLMSYQLSPVSGEDTPDQADVIKITEECATRTIRDFLKRSKTREVQQAEENGNMIRDEDMVYAVETNRQIKELTIPPRATFKQ